MGFGYERLRELRPDIVYVSMSGMGHTGPRSGWVSYADIVSAATGLTALTGWSSDQVVGVIYGHGDIVRDCRPRPPSSPHSSTGTARAAASTSTCRSWRRWPRTWAPASCRRPAPDGSRSRSATRTPRCRRTGSSGVSARTLVRDRRPRRRRLATPLRRARTSGLGGRRPVPHRGGTARTRNRDRRRDRDVDGAPARRDGRRPPPVRRSSRRGRPERPRPGRERPASAGTRLLRSRRPIPRSVASCTRAHRCGWAPR